MLLLIFLTIFGALPAEARIYDLYRADRRFKGAFCTAIGGACAADDDIVTAIFENPAALATGKQDWDFDGDYSQKSNLEPGTSNTNDASESTAVFGVSYTTGRFGFGIAGAVQANDVDSKLTLFDDSGLPKSSPVHTHADSYQIRLPIGYQLSPRLSIGLTTAVSWQTQKITVSGVSQPADNASSGQSLGFSFGAVYAANPRLRFGSWFRLPYTVFETLRVAESSLATTINYREDLALHNPWILAMGSQISIGDADLLFLELDLIGPTGAGYLFTFNTLSAAVNDSALTPKGRNLALEPHAGYRIPLGRKARLHAGTYLEAPRTSGVAGRLHGTGGVSIELFKLVDVIGGIDVASRFQQLIFTFR